MPEYAIVFDNFADSSHSTEYGIIRAATEEHAVQKARILHSMKGGRFDSPSGYLELKKGGELVSLISVLDTTYMGDKKTPRFKETIQKKKEDTAKQMLPRFTFPIEIPYTPGEPETGPQGQILIPVSLVREFPEMGRDFVFEVTFIGETDKPYKISCYQKGEPENEIGCPSPEDQKAMEKNATINEALFSSKPKKVLQPEI